MFHLINLHSRHVVNFFFDVRCNFLIQSYTFFIQKIIQRKTIEKPFKNATPKTLRTYDVICDPKALHFHAKDNPKKNDSNIFNTYRKVFFYVALKNATFEI